GDSGPAPCANSTWDDGNAVQHAVDAALQVQRQDVFKDLELCQQGPPITNLGIAGDGSDARVTEGFDQAANCPPAEDGVGVQSNDDRVAGRGKSDTQSLRLAGVRQLDHADTVPAECGSDPGRSIVGTVVDDDDLQLRIVTAEQSLQRPPDHFLLVVRRH